MTTVYRFDEGDLGKLMPEVKTFLSPGKTIMVWGVSEAKVNTGEFAEPARSLFWNLPTDERAFEGDDYWGLLLAESSLPIRDTLKMIARKRIPFAAYICQRPKQNTKGQFYWVMKPAELHYTKDGDLIDPNEGAI